MTTVSRLSLLSVVALSASAVQAATITTPTDSIVAVSHDLTAQYSLPDGNFPEGEGPTNAIDGNIGTKYLNFAGAGFNDEGVRVNNPTGFIVTLDGLGASPINGFRFATGNDAPSRDPSMITIEGTNRTGGEANNSAYLANNDGDSDYTLVYSGPSGIEFGDERSTLGDFISFPTSGSFLSYRIFITDLVRYPDNAPTNSQFGELFLDYTPVPEPTSLGLLGLGGLAMLRRRAR